MKILNKGGGAMNAVGSVRSFMNVVKDIDFEEVRERAETQPRVLIIGATEDQAQVAANRVFPEFSSANEITIRGWSDAEASVDGRWDLVIVTDPDGTSLLDKVRKAMDASARGTLFYLGDGTSDVDALRAEVTGMIPDLAPSFGRYFDSWRSASVRAIIDETSRANAQFALVSNIPAVIPILGGFVSASADLIVLTKNQVMMSYKIAAVHNRDLKSQMAVVRELTPVVGAGFLWRTLAREATSFIPLAAGTIPKVAIAFAGTMTVGRTVDYYYRFDSKPSKSQLEMFMSTAIKLANRLPFVQMNDETESKTESLVDADVQELDEGGSKP